MRGKEVLWFRYFGRMEMYWKSGKWRQLFSVSTAVVPMAHATANETGVHFMRFPLLKLSLLFLVWIFFTYACILLALSIVIGGLMKTY